MSDDLGVKKPVRFSFTITPEGHVTCGHQCAIEAALDRGKLTSKKKTGQLKNRIHNVLYPGSLTTLVSIYVIVLACQTTGYDPFYLKAIEDSLPCVACSTKPAYWLISSLLVSLVLWLAKILFLRTLLKVLLKYNGYLFESKHGYSLVTKIWFFLQTLLIKKSALLHDYEGCLPNLPLPALDQTINKYLLSIKHLHEEEEFLKIKKQAEEFLHGHGRKFQRFLWLKTWWSQNYVSDWWEEYAYLRSRAPLMINSNYYCTDYVQTPPTPHQASRAAMMVYCMLQHRRDIERQELSPIITLSPVPMCGDQFERQFNTTRVPGIETDTLEHYTDSDHIAVYHKGKYFKVYIRHKNQLLLPCEIESSLQKILKDQSEPLPGEEHLAALTAGERSTWATVREEFFSNGNNKTSLDTIEKAAFFLSLDTEPLVFNEDGSKTFNKNCHTLLHGNGHNIWFDKSFNFIVGSNATAGINMEHSWADGPIMGYLWETVFYREKDIGYRGDGRCWGAPRSFLPNPTRLEWDMSPVCQQAISASLGTAQSAIHDLTIHSFRFEEYGKKFIKTCKLSPDAFLQAAIQLAYFRMEKKFCLTYEPTMMRLYREGRTETIRSCTKEVTDFARAMVEGKEKSECINLLREAVSTHVTKCKEAFTGGGVDRHLFSLYVVSKYFKGESRFLQKALSAPWTLSTSQVSPYQTGRQEPEDSESGGGGFGPVSEDGYGISYMMVKDYIVNFHITCKKSCPSTDAKKLGEILRQSLCDMRDLFSS